MISRLWRLFANGGPRASRPTCRLTEAEALQIATASLGRDTPVVVQDVCRVAERIEWHVGTATIGSGTIVRIDDATGDVVATERWGIR